MDAYQIVTLVLCAITGGLSVLTIVTHKSKSKLVETITTLLKSNNILRKQLKNISFREQTLKTNNLTDKQLIDEDPTAVLASLDDEPNPAISTNPDTAVEYVIDQSPTD